MTGRAGTGRGGTRIGLDLDNTIVCYDALFHELAVERGMAADAAPVLKSAVRRVLCDAGSEDTWTEMQGEAYGPRMRGAGPFPGALELVAECRRRGLEVCIVSHRTRTPYRGPAHDLHASARAWLDEQGLAGDGVEVFLEEDRDAKAARIAELDCSCFVDDLAGFLTASRLPDALLRVHFDPSGAHAHAHDARLRCVDSWAEIREVAFGAVSGVGVGAGRAEGSR